MRVLALLIRLALVVCVSGVVPATLLHANEVRGETCARFHARRPAPLKALNGVGRSVSRDGSRSDAPLRGKHAASALPATAPVLGLTVGASVVPQRASARRPVERRATVSPRAPPSLI